MQTNQSWVHILHQHLYLTLTHPANISFPLNHPRANCRGYNHPVAKCPPDQIRSDQSLSRVQFFVTPWITAHQASPTPRVHPNSCALSWWCHPTISSSVSSFDIQPCHPPLSSPSPLAFNLSQHQGPFKWVSCLHQVAKVLEFQLQHQSFQWIFRTDFL